MCRGITNQVFTRHQDQGTLVRYTLLYKRLVAMLVRATRLHAADSTQHPWVTDSEELHTALKSLCQLLARPVVQAETLQPVLSQLNIALWQRPWVSTVASPLIDPTGRFCALHSLRSDGSHTPVKFITQVFAQFKYIIRLHILTVVHANKQSIQFMETLSPWYTENAELSTFSLICNWQHTASSFSIVESVLPEIHWTDRKNWSKFTYRGEAITLEGIRGMVHAIEHDLVQVWEKDVLLGLPLTVDTCHLKDDTSSIQPGYSFYTDRANNLVQHKTMLAHAILNNSKLAAEYTQKTSAGVQWSINSLNRWLQKYQMLSALLLVGCETTMGGPRRGTELTSMLVTTSKAQAIRNLYIVDQYPMLLATYSKTSARFGKDTCIPHALPAVIADILIQSLIIARPFANFAIKVCYPQNPEYAELYKTYLFVNYTSKFTTDHLTELLKKYSMNSLGVVLGILAWRHVSIALRRKLCKRGMKIMSGYGEDGVAIEQAGHSASVEQKLYGISYDAAIGLQEDRVHEFLDASCYWQQLICVCPGASATFVSFESSG